MKAFNFFSRAAKTLKRILFLLKLILEPHRKVRRKWNILNPKVLLFNFYLIYYYCVCMFTTCVKAHVWRLEGQPRSCFSSTFCGFWGLNFHPWASGSSAFTTVKGTDSQSLRLKLPLKTKALVGWSSKLPEGRRAISGGNWHHPKS